MHASRTVGERWSGRRRGVRHGARRRAFTIIELIVVMAMLAILAAMGLPRLRTTGYKADAAAQLTRSLLQAAQRDAITRQSNVIVSIDTAFQRVRVVQDGNNNDAIDAGERVQWRRLEEGTRFAAPTMGRVGGAALAVPYAGTALRTVSALPSIVFRRDGSASSDAEFYLTLRTAVPNEYRAIVVAPATGRVDIYRYGGTAWVRATP